MVEDCVSPFLFKATQLNIIPLLRTADVSKLMRCVHRFKSALSNLKGILRSVSTESVKTGHITTLPCAGASLFRSEIGTKLSNLLFKSNAKVNC